MSEREEGYRAGQLDTRLTNVEAHLRAVNGSIAHTATELNSVVRAFDKLESRLDERDKQIARALEERTRKEGFGLGEWQIRLAILALAAAVISPIILRFWG